MKDKRIVWSLLIPLVLTGSASALSGVIAGWDRFSADGSPASPAQAGSPFINASLSWIGEDQFRDNGSGDGTFGTFGSGAETNLTGGGLSSIRWNNTSGIKSITVVISNSGPDTIAINQFHFDAFREWDNSLGCTYELTTGGDITATNTGSENLIKQSETLADGAVADFQDVDIDLSGLASNTLAAGQYATFTLLCTGGTFSGTIYDNVAVSGSGWAETNFPPFFPDTLNESSARVGRPYTMYVMDDAWDFENDPLVFSKASGPDWLLVSSNGVVTGTAGSTDEGTNTLEVSLSDGNQSRTGLVHIMVLPEQEGIGNNHSPFRPNVVFIMADDLGLGDIGFYHRERTGTPEVVPTPNLDSLISAGMRFNHAHTPAALCSPTRYCVMTGNYTFRAAQPYGDWWSWGTPNILPGQTTVGSMMRDAGYRTAFFGKYGMSSTWTGTATGGPRDGLAWSDWSGVHLDRIAPELPGVVSPKNIGFDYTLSLQAGIQQSPDIVYENDWWMPLDPGSVIDPNLAWADLIDPDDKAHGGPGDSHWSTKQIGHLLAQKAVDFTDDTLTHHPGKPFFLYYCAQAVHHPHVPPDTFDGAPVKGVIRNPGDPDAMIPYGDMIYELDLQVGKVVQHLKDQGVYSNTLIIVTSDNGGLKLDELEAWSNHDSSNGFRGKKSQIYEGGHRVPFIAVWPGRIPAGVECNEKIMVQDLMATLYALTGQTQSEDSGLDSFNLMPLMLGVQGSKGRDQMLIQGAESNRLAIVQGDWKLVIQTDRDNLDSREPFALFNLAENPYEDEAQNRINDPAQTNRVAELLAEYNRVRGSDAGDPAGGQPLPRTSVPVNPVLLDTDGDGMPDSDEVVAGTDYFNPDSLFRVRGHVSAQENAGFELHFDTVTGRTYTVHYRTNLVAGALNTLTNGIPGNDSEALVISPVEDPARFYSVEVTME